MSKTEKQKIGDWGEEQACSFLVKEGYKIVERNYKVTLDWVRGEIDIIAKDPDGVLSFVEVKTRGSGDGSAERATSFEKKVGKIKKKEAVKVGGFMFDYDMQTLTINGEEKRLTTKEADLLNMLCENRYDVLDRNYALNKIWGDDNYFNSRSMDVYIAKLRKYLASDPEVELVNVHGKGFKLLAGFRKAVPIKFRVLFSPSRVFGKIGFIFNLYPFKEFAFL